MQALILNLYGTTTLVLLLLCTWNSLIGFIAIGKKLLAICKDKDCEDLKPWLQSIINHVYWAAASTPPGEGDLVVAKWKSVERHVMNIHKNHGDLFPACTHDKLRGRR